MENKDPATAKKAIRARIKNIRARLDQGRLKALGSQVCALVRQLPCWQGARSVALYHALPGEVPTDDLLAELWACAGSGAKQKTVWLPRLIRPASSGLMEFVPCPGPECLRPGPFGLMEPDPGLPGLKLVGPDSASATSLANIPANSPDLYIVPGLAFDRSGGRLGFGGGYYDRWLAGALAKSEEKRPVFVGLCFAFQLLPALPLEPWDSRMDYLCSEDETICL